ncbi:hypothetical protein BB560_002365 [Smittium megazygosporum]|uniref:CRESS-DNA virus Rep endonuclease domain-containing protein n=1 Tax=Smittium megazygosporum TaxID=133381 RepID=A0A2T9ZEY9_9FUNG|nr:hypothetical protein BB560_002365 [Smittium megazygosporum]
MFTNVLNSPDEFDISGVFGNSFKASNNFRLSSKGYFLTYPQFEFSKQQVLDEFKTIGINPIKYIIAQENHNLSDGNHIHVYMVFEKHGCYETIKNHSKAIRYVTKGGNYLTNMSSEEINSAINLGQSRISDGLRVMAASSLQEMKDIVQSSPSLVRDYLRNPKAYDEGLLYIWNNKVAAMAEQNQNEIAAKELEEQRKKYRFKEFPLVDLWVRNLFSLWLRGRTNIGKTFYALSLFHNPLLVSDLEGLKLLDYTKHDGIIFDDMDFSKASRSLQLHLTDLRCTRNIAVKFGSVILRAGFPRIFTSNDKIFKKDEAIARRIWFAKVEEDLRLRVPSTLAENEESSSDESPR